MSPERLGNLIDAHAGPLELFAAQWTNAPEDAVQEAFIELAKRDTEPERTVPWLYTVVRNRAISAARSTQRRHEHEGRAGALVGHLVPRTESELDARTAAEAVQALPEEQREVVIARIWGGLGFAEIGQIVGASSSTTHRRFEAAISSLRERLGLQWTVHERPTNDATQPAPREPPTAESRPLSKPC